MRQVDELVFTTNAEELSRHNHESFIRVRGEDQHMRAQELRNSQSCSPCRSWRTSGGTSLVVITSSFHRRYVDGVPGPKHLSNKSKIVSTTATICNFMNLSRTWLRWETLLARATAGRGLVSCPRCLGR